MVAGRQWVTCKGCGRSWCHTAEHQCSPVDRWAASSEIMATILSKVQVMFLKPCHKCVFIGFVVNDVAGSPWHFSRGCWGTDQGLNKQETWGVLALHSLTKGFLKRLSAKINGELFNLNRNQLIIMMELLTEHYNSKWSLFKLWPVDSPGCDRCKYPYETASHILCDCKALAVLRFMHLGHYFLQWGDFVDISVRKVLHFIWCCWMLKQRAALQIRKWPRCKHHCSGHPAVLCPHYVTFG